MLAALIRTTVYGLNKNKRNTHLLEEITADLQPKTAPAQNVYQGLWRHDGVWKGGKNPTKLPSCAFLFNETTQLL